MGKNHGDESLAGMQFMWISWQFMGISCGFHGNSCGFHVDLNHLTGLFFELNDMGAGIVYGN